MTDAVAPGRVTPGRYLLLLLQLGLLALVLRQFQIENNALVRLALLTFAGFAVHALLPMRMRLPSFALLSLAGIGFVFGLQEGAWLAGLGFGLIGVCHLPLPFRARVALLLGLGAGLAALRVGWLEVPWSAAVWPILGSMFMFRLIVYMYELRYETQRGSVWNTIAYFFMLPNICFPLFPVVDFKTFRRTYYNTDAAQIYQTGVDWMVRGVSQLILYRVVYYYMTLAPSEVTGPATFAQYMVSNFLLYLRVSGQFHLIVGMLCLFGFHLPETHHRYLLASSFTDFWRRINIYWKDFMQKVFYYPAYFALRRLGTTTALVLATCFVFLATWLLHAYQWFWLRGSFLLSAPDVLFWTILAGLVVINSLWEISRGRTRTLGKTRWTWRSFSGVALRTAGTFTTICVLWSLWTAESVGAWLGLWTTLEPWVAIAPVLPAVAVAAITAAGPTRRDEVAAGGSAGSGRGWWDVWRRPAVQTVFVLLLLTLLGLPAVYTRLGPEAATVITSLRSGRLSRLDTAMLERGYYEDLLSVDRFNSALWQVYLAKPNDWLGLENAGLERFTGDFQQRDLVPSFVVSTRFGAITTNRFGMRDGDYAQQPAPGTYRAAILGASTVMGWGVADGETFEALLESRLNQEATDGTFTRYEILNFAVPGLRPLQMLTLLERKALGFDPNAVIYVAPGRELSQAALSLVEAVHQRIPIPYPYLQEVVARAGIDANSEESVAMRKLEPMQGEILSWLYREIVERCRARGALPVLAFLPQVYDGAWKLDTPETLQRAKDAGFVVIDLSDVYDGEDVTSLRLAEWDNHPNARGHRLIADRLYDHFEARGGSWTTSKQP